MGRFLPLAVVVGSLLVLSGHAQNDGSFNFKKTKEDRDFEVGECIFDVGLSSFYLMRAGLEITASTRSCPLDMTASCTFDIAGSVASIANTVDFLAAAISSCPPEYMYSKSRCVADISKLVGAVADIIAAAAGIEEMCKLTGVAGEGVSDRRLRGSGRSELNPLHSEDRPFEIAMCTVDSSQSALYLGRAGLEITSATRNCPESHEGLACGASVSGTIASLSFVAAFLSSAASECAASFSPSAFCSSDISRMTAGLAEIAAASSGIAESCVSMNPLTDLFRQAPAAHRKLSPIVSNRSATGRGTSAAVLDTKIRQLHARDALIEEEHALFWKAANGGGWTRRDLEHLVARHPGRGLRLAQARLRATRSSRKLATTAASRPLSGVVSYRELAVERGFFFMAVLAAVAVAVCLPGDKRTNADKVQKRQCVARRTTAQDAANTRNVACSAHITNSFVENDA
eukprot:TRINITY_DN10252_c0_g1_i1.p1 TRINITY_DN10252_c0_g1~~TRINITY_DN10252_c0_g1_i1.p1  ORF type:complete len:458 (+),score=62.96 TRINITY_DN10252_c0_g1_i1:133-1506(+)